MDLLTTMYSSLLEQGLGLEEENEIRTTALVVIDRLECWSKKTHSSSISGKDDVP